MFNVLVIGLFHGKKYEFKSCLFENIDQDCTQNNHWSTISTNPSSRLIINSFSSVTYNTPDGIVIQGKKWILSTSKQLSVKVIGWENEGCCNEICPTTSSLFFIEKCFVDSG